MLAREARGSSGRKLGRKASASRSEVAAELLLRTLQRKEVRRMEWITPDFEELDTSAEVTAYAGRWDPAE
jgi:coenzyme PQQ precursor peptide PqqA